MMPRARQPFATPRVNTVGEAAFSRRNNSCKRSASTSVPVEMPCAHLGNAAGNLRSREQKAGAARTGTEGSDMIRKDSRWQR
jgi:hypothetical protein